MCRCTSTQYAHYTIGVSATGPLQSISVSNSETALGTSFSHTRVTAPSSHSQSTGRKKKEKKKEKKNSLFLRVSKCSLRTGSVRAKGLKDGNSPLAANDRVRKHMPEHVVKIHIAFQSQLSHMLSFSNWHYNVHQYTNMKVLLSSCVLLNFHVFKHTGAQTNT